jgi:5'-nucleotidase (lipoprotein e(P4) family)
MDTVRHHSGTLLLALLASLSLTGCATRPVQPATTRTLSNDVHWYRDAAEQRAIYAEVYSAATGAARSHGAKLPAGSWGVILDVDETVLDNSEYQKRLALTGTAYTSATWDAWVREKQATALPGAKAFIDTVLDELQGHVVFVTNRTQAQCTDTEANLRTQGIRFDLVLCDSGDGNKNPRFDAVIAGKAGIAAINVVLWVGDNIQDFPGLDQQHPGDAAKFGSSYFVLPNPMYGSWQRLPAR